MPNPTLTDTQREAAMTIVRDVDERIRALAAGDESLTFAYLRKVSKELVYLERDSPAKRKRVKRQVWKAQGEICAECKEALPFRYSVADRREATKGYVPENIEVIHGACDRVRQERKAYH
jgi:hypothetical protein